MANLNFPNAAYQAIPGAGQYRNQSSKKVALGGFCVGGALKILSAVRVPEMDPDACFYGIPLLTPLNQRKSKFPWSAIS
jgi:carboxymethylenebutenolidase